MTDRITYRLPDNTEVYETLQEAVSDAYHREWSNHSRLLKRDKKDKEAGKKLSRKWFAGFTPKKIKPTKQQNRMASMQSHKLDCCVIEKWHATFWADRLGALRPQV